MRGAKRRMRILRGGMSHPTMDATSACTTLSHVSYAALFCVEFYTVERLCWVYCQRTPREGVGTRNPDAALCLAPVCACVSVSVWCAPSRSRANKDELGVRVLLVRVGREKVCMINAYAHWIAWVYVNGDVCLCGSVDLRACVTCQTISACMR